MSLQGLTDAIDRVPIAALLTSDRPTVSAVRKFELHGRTYYEFQNAMYNFPSDDV